MKKYIVLIRESQYNELQKFIVESQVYTKQVKLVLNELVSNYEPALTPTAAGSEYVNSIRIKKKIDGSEITPKELLRYLGLKFDGISDEFIKQVVIDWYNGDIGDDLSLSRNVSY